MPISTIPVKWLNSQSNQRTSRFEVSRMSEGIAEPERSQIYESDKITGAALVAQPAERRFRNSSLIP
jgi:hypothetical protein